MMKKKKLWTGIMAFAMLFQSGTFSVFVSIPPELAEQADSVVLDVVTE